MQKIKTRLNTAMQILRTAKSGLCAAWTTDSHLSNELVIFVRSCILVSGRTKSLK